MTGEYYTKYTPDFNVGIGDLILGETAINDSPVISALELEKNLSQKGFIVDYWNFDKNGYYLREYDKKIFKERPSLKFETLDFTLTRISCVIKDSYRNAMLNALIQKYGFNRRNEWKIKGIYRTEIVNKYGTIQVNFDENETFKRDVLTDSNKVVNEIFLEMYFVKVVATKSKLEEIDRLENNKKQQEKQKEESENRIKDDVNRLFNFD